jgi:hypothetical protein
MIIPCALWVAETAAHLTCDEFWHATRFKARLRPMRGLKRLRSARVISTGHAFVQNIRRGHYELGTEETANIRVLAAFDELTLAI